MSQSYFCPDCCVNWSPHHCANSQCPGCWGGVKRVQEEPSPEAADLHKSLMRTRVERDRSEHNHKLFAEFLTARQIAADAERFAAQETGPIDTDAIRRGLDDDDEPEQFGEAA